MTKKEVMDFNESHVGSGPSAKGYGFTYFALDGFRKGQTIMHGWGKIIDHQTPHISVQIGWKQHYLPKKLTGKYWNHSCSPNAFVKTRPDGFPDLVAAKDIAKEEEISYSYWMTEFAWSKHADENSVTCRCGQKNCKGKILSFSQLSPKEQANARNSKICSKYLLTAEK